MRYAELHCRTNFSFLEGASHPDELVQQAAELGYAALAVTDVNSLAGVVRAYVPAKDLGFKLIVGAEVTPTWSSLAEAGMPASERLDHIAPPPRVVLWPTDRAAYGRLTRLLTLGRRRAEKGGCVLTLEDLAAHSEGLIAGILPDAEPDPIKAPGSVTLKAPGLAGGPPTESPAYPRICPPAEPGAFKLHSPCEPFHLLREIFPHRSYLLAEFHYGAADHRHREQLLHLSQMTGLPLVAAGDVHYHTPQRMMLQHVLTAIRHGVTVAQLGKRCLPNAERHLRSLEQLQTIFAPLPGALERTIEIADRCQFSLSELKYDYPRELAPPGETPMAYLRRLSWEKAAERYPDAIPEKVQALLHHELQLIEELHYEAFFLTVYDLVRYARSRDILCQGRGSAANSAVCFCLGVTAVDPVKHEMLFERFISQERQEAPDIDVDFEHERREEVLQYLYNKYGRERAGLAATVITYRSRSAVRDVGKALGLSLERVDALAKHVDHYGEDRLAKRCRQAGLDPTTKFGQQFIWLVNQLAGFPRHLSQHVGGMVITQGPLCELVPIENAAMADRTVIQWDKDDLDELGILKVDCLCLGMLTAIRKCFDLVNNPPPSKGGARGGISEQITNDEGKELPPNYSSFTTPDPLPTTHSPPLSIATIPDDDKPVYDMICRADTIGVFQIESRAQMSMLPRLRPRVFYDLVIEVAIVRPGPIQGNMVHPYLRRKNGEEEPTYPSPEVEHVLKRTLGVPLFQEQAMQLAIVAAGFTPGEADQLRRAMAAWRRPGLIDEYHDRLVHGMLAKGYTIEFAEQLFEQIRGFGEYGFPESHAASFAKLAYVSSWLKCYYPAAFTAALINSQPMGFYAPAQLIRDAREHGVEILPIDVNHSTWDCTLENDECFGPSSSHSSFVIRHSSFSSLRLGLRLIRGLPERDAQSIIAARTSAPFTSVADLTARARLGRGTVKKLADADAFGSLALNRRAALWQALDQTPSVEDLPLFASLEQADTSTPALPTLTPQQEVYADYSSAGLSLRSHPMAFFRDQLAAMNVLTARELLTQRNGRSVRVAGLVLMRQRPGTAKGITFVTLEDETGTANLIIHLQTFQKYELAARRASALLVEGRLERKDQVVHVLARRIADLQATVKDLHHHSRDFR